MGCWYHAKTVRISEYEDIEDDDDSYDDDDGVAKVTFLVADHEEGDKIDIDVSGDSSVTPETALQIAAAIRKVYKWGRSKAAQSEIQRLRDVHAKRDEEDRLKREAKRAAPTGRPDSDG